MNLKEANSWLLNHGHRKSQQLAYKMHMESWQPSYAIQEPDIIEVTSWKDETRQMYFNSIQQDRPTFMTSQLGIHRSTRIGYGWWFATMSLFPAFSTAKDRVPQILTCRPLADQDDLLEDAAELLMKQLQVLQRFFASRFAVVATSTAAVAGMVPW